MKNKAPTKNKFRDVCVPTTALAQSINFDKDYMHVHLTDGRIISIPVIGFPLLYEATPKQREKYEIGAGGSVLHWPEIDEDISIASLLAGADTRWL